MHATYKWLALLFPLAGMADTNCDQVSKIHYVDGWKEARSVLRIDQKITQDGRILCSYYPDREQQLNLLVVREHGYLNSTEYELHYADGSAVIQGHVDKSLEVADYDDNWHLSCRDVDAVGKVLCSLKKDDIVIKQVSGNKTLMIGADHQDGSDILVRVKGQRAINAPVAEGFSQDRIEQILRQMYSGESVDTRFHARDKQRPTDKATSLYGFDQAMLLLNTVEQQLNARQQAATP